MEKQLNMFNKDKHPKKRVLAEFYSTNEEHEDHDSAALKEPEVSPVKKVRQDEEAIGEKEKKQPVRATVIVDTKVETLKEELRRAKAEKKRRTEELTYMMNVLIKLKRDLSEEKLKNRLALEKAKKEKEEVEKELDRIKSILEETFSNFWKKYG